MKIKSFLARPYASIIHGRIRKGMATAVADQKSVLQQLLKTGSRTSFGQAHQLKDVKTYDAYRQAVPVRDYEAFRPYIEEIKNGQQNVLWKGRPIYFAKTSGTTSGIKYIPVTKDSIHNHIDTARNALLCYMAEKGNTSFADGKMIFLSGSPVLERVGGIPTGRLSGIVNHFIPRYLRSNQLPSYETNCIEDWEEKLGKIVEETLKEDMTLISGIPPWMQMYFDWLLEKTHHKTIGELFPNLQVLVHGGVNYEPYKARMIESIGRPVDMIETFPASEGFFAFQDLLENQGLLLNTNSGIFFEFIPVSEFFKEDPPRLSLEDVQTDVNYAMIISSNAGLWGYNLGDTVKFVSTNPYRIMVTGRIKHFISAFGEHVIGEEVEHALEKASRKHDAVVIEFTVAPRIQVSSGLPRHEWFIAFEHIPSDLEAFSRDIDQALREKNIYYDDLITGNILQPLQIVPVQKHAFREYMKSEGKLGGQNKVPRLCNDRAIADTLMNWAL